MNFKNYTTLAKYDIYKQLEEELHLEIKSELYDEKEKEFELIPLRESIKEAQKRLDNPGGLDGISTGYKNLDSYLGGFAPEELIVVAGGTGTGKTQYVQSIILNMVLDNNPVLFFTLEMPPVETTVRFMRMIKSKLAGDVLPELPIYYYYGTNVNTSVLEKAIQKGITLGVKCVVIDHIHFFAKNNDNQAAEVGNIAREIKLLARKYKIPIILIAHIRKTGSPTRIPTLEDIKDSSGVAQDADSVLMVWRDTESLSEEVQKELKVKVRKNRRRGTLGGCQYKLDHNYFLQEMEYDSFKEDF
jgi:replicative DNA helicase